MTKSRAEVVDFTVPFYEEPSTFLIKRPTEYKLASYLNPFQVSTEVIHRLKLMLDFIHTSESFNWCRFWLAQYLQYPTTCKFDHSLVVQYAVCAK